MNREVGALREITRFPVKSMLGETLPAAEVTSSGIVGDRGLALVDAATGKVASAKHPQLWSGLLGFRARYRDGDAPAVHVEAPGGTTVRSSESDVDSHLSALVGRAVRLAAAPPSDVVFDEVWPDVPDLVPEEVIVATRTGTTEDAEPISSLPVALLAPGTFQDLAPVSILTTSSLRTAARLHPAGDWDARRFRPTLLLDDDGDGFREQDLAGRRLRIGDVVLDVLAPIPRCVMVTLAQQELPPDIDVLRTLAKHNRLELPGMGRSACLGVYGTVVTPGRITAGQTVMVS